jgi:hypothetical protein
MKFVTRLILIVFLCICGSVFAKQCAQDEQNGELFRAAEARIRRLKWFETLDWNELIRTKQQRYYPCWYFLEAPRAFIWNKQIFLRDGMIYHYFVVDTAAQLLDREVLADLTKIKEDYKQSHRLRIAAGRMLRLADELGVYPDNIYQRRESKSAPAVAGPAVQAQAPQAPVESEPGTVLAVAIGGNSLCMIEGVDQVLGRGDTINQGFGEGIKVVKLEPGQVELQKGRRTWVQKIGESPSGQWE